MLTSPTIRPSASVLISVWADTGSVAAAKPLPRLARTKSRRLMSPPDCGRSVVSASVIVMCSGAEGRAQDSRQHWPDRFARTMAPMPIALPAADAPLAAIDMGSNSFRLEVGQMVGGGYRRIDYLKETVRL